MPRADKLSFENDDGTIMAEEIFQQQLLSYRPIPPPPQLPDCPEEEEAQGGEAPPAPAQPAAKPAASPAGKAPARGAGGRGGGAAPAKSNAAAEARAKQLGGEAEVRAQVVAVRDGLSRGLDALAALAAGDPAFTAGQLDGLRPLVLPLLTSPLVGARAAFGCCRQLAACLPGELGGAALPLACSLRLAQLTEKVGAGRRGRVCTGVARRQCGHLTMPLTPL
jgi:hypothetical protein